MCEKTSVLIFFLVLKIVVLFLLPAFIIYFRIKFRDEREKVFNILFIVECLLLILLIGLKITNNSCITNSSISNIKRINAINDSTSRIIEDADQKEISYVLPEIIEYNSGKRLLYYNNSKLPLSNKIIQCSNKNIYMKNYGTSIATMATLVSTELNEIVNPVEILNLALDNNLVNCTTGIDFASLINIVQAKYKVSIREISYNDIESYINNGKVVIEKIHFNPDFEDNMTCNEGYIVIYEKTGNNYKIMNINRKPSLSDYICSETTVGRYTAIKQSSSDKSYTLDALGSIGLKYYVAEGVN